MYCSSKVNTSCHLAGLVLFMYMGVMHGKGQRAKSARLRNTTAKVAFTPYRKNFPEASSSQLSLLYEGRTRDTPVREKSIPSAYTNT